MRALTIEFTDAEYRKLFKAKRVQEIKKNTSYSWKDFFLTFSNGVSVKKVMTSRHRAIKTELKGGKK